MMALSGLVLFLFVIGHMAGNLKVFFGADASTGVYLVDHYAEILRTVAADFMGRASFLWIVRITLFSSGIIHAVTGIQLWLLNRRAKPSGYEEQSYLSATISSRSMFYGGIFIGLFAVFHILHFTLGGVAAYSFEQGRVYSNLYHSFLHGYLVVLYVAAVLFLALHLYHGAWSIFQTLGVDNPGLNGSLRVFAKVAAIVLFLGFSAVPVSIYFGFVPPPARGYSMQIEHAPQGGTRE